MIKSRRLRGPKRSPAKIFVVSAPSGCGKTTLCNRLLADDLGLTDSISMTTRSPRPGEEDGVDYHFVSRRKFRTMVRTGGFLEYEENFGNSYGTPRKFITDNIGQGKSVLLNIDVKGAMKIKKAFPHKSVLIFLLPPSVAELKKRLRLRRSDTAEVINERLRLAKKELAYKSRYDHRVVNDDLDKAYRRLRRIVAANTGSPYK